MKILLELTRISRNHQKRQLTQGFTVLELLIVVFIIGILGSIATPAMLSQAAKARQAEAKSFIGSINRAQQAYMVEKLKFANSLANLNILGDSESSYYSYTVNATLTQGSVVAIPLSENVSKTYTGAATVYINQAVLKTIICESPVLNDQNPSLPQWDPTGPTLFCPSPMLQVYN